ncbi:RluA family pseudouridine synthase [Shewanella violacea]|uniref:Ribosomal large subunit pseudouridine synthase A n=1 Tax=Shewanella violacea (strain JCM 10179 / CIP 106290 / LMG 19151 / DSS12) TaxID=637905 RepID=D4ZAQ3_SHEVD|nr:RluA family pseudouridine synthase [Shewanella violacea]BAJ03098.1 ribosomal large subunit pseudouridine synthase A [Shewanella violacea DSS12]
MHSPEHCFTSFKASTAEFTLPELFTFPFYYEPHPLCLLAASELQQHLETQTDWQHNFGLHEAKGSGLNVHGADGLGKMFGVLLVKNEQGELGYLSAFSGKIADQNLLPHLVPPVFDMLAKDGFFIPEQDKINLINAEITEVNRDPDLARSQTVLADETQLAEQQIAAHRASMIENRKHRKSQRLAGESLDEDALKQLGIQMSRESVQDKNRLKELNVYWDERLANARLVHGQLNEHLSALKLKRKTMSAALQQRLFDEYRFLNIKSEHRSLGDIFKGTIHKVPPAGSGECAAPKLLHFAFKHGMTPLAMAEFWWGEAPKSEIRQHKNFYGACQGKCQPILGHMLEGLATDENPLLINPAEGKLLDIIYQDRDILVINKPAEFLSVPGRNIDDSVYSRIKQLYPEATGPLIVHRLDMSTSGLMVIALNKAANKSLQKQFITRTVKKRYVALLTGELSQDEGIISLPLRGDFDDRPRQLVCFEHGKPAETKWQVISRRDGLTKVHLYPKTGRTHQLRVHSAHPKGLNMPIVGDDLYGKKSQRLHLHAELLALNHPTTGEAMSFSIEADF